VVGRKLSEEGRDSEGARERGRREGGREDEILLLCQIKHLMYLLNDIYASCTNVPDGQAF
jgi:hypothetical protein